MLIRWMRTRFQQEKLSAQLRWWLAAEGTAFWLHLVERRLTKILGERKHARRMIARAAAPAWRRRYQELRRQHSQLPSLDDEPEALGQVFKGLYPGPIYRTADWVMAEVGGPARGIRQRGRATRRLAPLDAEAKWQEVTVHLGELLVSFTEELPGLGLKQTNSVLGQLCYDFGVRLTTMLKWVLRLPNTPDSAVEVLRMGEYIFRVNPEHEAGSDAEASTAYIEGNACPWFPRPGWGGMHCGIFGRFQDGCSSVFGMNYRLTRTIPRHGGEICRVELRPIKLRRASRPALSKGTSGPPPRSAASAKP